MLKKIKPLKAVSNGLKSQRLVSTKLIFKWIYFRGCKFYNISCGLIFAFAEYVLFWVCTLIFGKEKLVAKLS